LAAHRDAERMKLYVAAVALVGCTQSSSPVKAHLTWRYPDGTAVPADLTQVQYQVLVENGDHYDRYPDQPVTGTADGTFEIPDVPDGPYWIEGRHVGSDSYPTIVRREDHDIDEGQDVLGRPDDVLVAAPTPLMIDATNMGPWGAQDALAIDCWNNATEAWAPTFTPALAVGAQEIHGSFDWSSMPAVYSFGRAGLPYLMRAGDHVTISHETDLQTTPVSTSALTQVLDTDAPAQMDGQSATLGGTFVDVSRTEQMSVTIDPTAFETQPGLYTNWYVRAVAGQGSAQRFGIGPDLFAVGQSTPMAASTTTVSYGDPFDPAWTPLLQASFELEWKVDGFSLYIQLAYEERPLDTGAFTFEPVPPPKDLTIDGQSITGTVAGMTGASLTLKAKVPDGTSAIEVSVRHLTSGPGSYPELAGDMYAEHMPIQLPAEIFKSGDRYALEIIAYANDGARSRYSTATTDVFTYTAQ
jgi:hypothetical protein